MRRRWWPLLLATAALSVVWYLVAAFTPIGPVKVVDGDTIKRNGVRHRLAGYDAPELRSAQCPNEREMGRTAAARLEQLIAGAKGVRLVTVGRPDRWGRPLSRLLIDDTDIAEFAIKERWGVPYAGRGPRHDWCR